MNFDEIVSTRLKESEERNDPMCWRALAEMMAMECLRLELNGDSVPMDLRIRADDAYQKYLDFLPKRDSE